MTLLLLSDLHSRAEWFRWAAGQASDLTAIAGDLLDGFRSGGLLPQMVSLKRWADHFPRPLALSSGNHDGNLEAAAFAEDICQMPDRSAVQSLLTTEFWMDSLERPGVVTDRRSQIIETPGGKIVVTTIPFFTGNHGPRVSDKLWAEGSRLRVTSRALWLVLHHEPPADTMVGGLTGDPSVFYKIREYQPDFVLSGHIHGQPYAGSFADKIGRTWCFNPGVPVISRAIRTKIPNHIWIDTTNGTATWKAAPNVGRIPITETIAL